MKPAMALVPTESGTSIALLEPKKDEVKTVELDIFRVPMMPVKKRKPKAVLEEEQYVEVGRVGPWNL